MHAPDAARPSRIHTIKTDGNTNRREEKMNIRTASPIPFVFIRFDRISAAAAAGAVSVLAFNAQ